MPTDVGRAALPGFTNALNCVLEPALVIDQNGLVLDVNRRAHEMFDGDIRVHNHRLFVRDRHARTLLDRVIAQLCTNYDLDEFSVDPIAIRRDGRPPVILRVLPIHSGAREPFLGARALLITLIALSPREPASPALLAQAFGLTPAEAKIAAIIARGATIGHAAEVLGISQTTARNQLKAVFAKTGTHRQSELAALLARL